MLFIKTVVFSLWIILLTSAVFAGNILLDDSLPPGPNYRIASFRLWYNNNNAGKIRGVIVLVPGSNSDGRNMTDDPEWQQLAVKYNFALLGCYFTDKPHENMAIEHYADVSKGSGPALLKSLADFAGRSGHRELAAAPLLFWGVSAGGEFNYEFACWMPERTLAFVVNKGGIYYTNQANAETRKVPGLFFTGQEDMALRTDVVRGIFSANRRFGALWTYLEEPGTGHEFARSKKMAELFFDEIIPARLPGSPGPDEGTVKLTTLQEKDGLTGDLKTFEIFVNNAGRDYDYPTSWLLNKKVAAAWQKIVTGLPF